MSRRQRAPTVRVGTWRCARPALDDRDAREADMSESPATRSFTLAPGDGDVAASPIAARIVFKVRGRQSDGAVTMFETQVPPGAGPPLHLHEGQDECMYVLAGDVRVRIGDDVALTPAGSFAFFCRGVAHCWQNVGPEPARILVMTTPAGLEQLFERFTALGDRPAAATAFDALGPAAGVQVVGAPLAESHPLARA
jgi:quercetin dioxygenase-like cupin family protein